MVTDGDDDNIMKAPGTVPKVLRIFVLAILSTTPLMLVVQILKLRHREVKSLTQGHTDRSSQ